ncbi:uncharacterized protein LOC119681821 [Teleopsis dalmanni]|uniref:uncharacterized protein LOC119664037 n=1 Tax=Teleopsis dalmanni TaxID=139649 RepID=UPI000D32BE06|nr:uncharacterized protein LOC119664037 [Teleopsis dalmanni]XP_037951038.1 uncharacterized protein LOC119681821 [Teleopsis dalmanni]
MSTNGDIKNPNENLNIPEWICAEHFKALWEKDVPDYVKVLKFTPVAAIPPGENFTSVMIRLYVDFELKDGTTKQKSYVLKTMLDEDKGGREINRMSLFPKEKIMYEKYLPAFEALYVAAGKKVQLAPQCLFIENLDERINLVFEDLKPRGYQNVDRLKGFDMAHMKRVLERLAELHAVSAVYAQKHGPYPTDFQYSFFNADKINEDMEFMYTNKVTTYKAAMAKWGLENAQNYIDKIPTFEQFTKSGMATLDIDVNGFNVLTHGDFWSSNIMLNYLPDGAIDRLLFVDYQICKWGCPTEDLVFFISISAAKDIRLTEYDHFIEIYYEFLIENLKLLKYNGTPPKLRDLQMGTYKAHSTFYAFMAVYNHLVAVLLPTDKDSNIHSLMRTDEFGEQFRMRTFTNPLYVEAMKDLFPFYHRRGVLNFEDFD